MSNYKLCFTKARYQRCAQLWLAAVSIPLLGAACIVQPGYEYVPPGGAATVDLINDDSCILLPGPQSADPAGKFANEIRVSTEPELQGALASLQPDTLIILAPGTYRLTQSLFVRKDNVTLRGDSERCDEVVLQGLGMDNPDGRTAVPHGVWSDADDLSIQNLTIRDVWFHGLALNAGAQSPSVYNVRFLDNGQQMIKASDTGSQPNVNGGRVEYSVFEYTNGPTRIDHGGGTGYTNGVDVHGGQGWEIRGNRFENFHTPDDADQRWNPAILMWNGASDTIVDGNVFIDVDRAIALGLVNRDRDHSGGMIRNNMIVTSKNLFSESRRASSDAMILAWDSEGTQILHNTVLTQGNQQFAIQLRFDSGGSRIANNLSDAPIGDRSGNTFEEFGNVQINDDSLFRDVGRGDLHLTRNDPSITNVANPLGSVIFDIDNEARTASEYNDVGADEIDD